ncbi:hypothetical protein HK104_002375 [Borealophlyctis nickersoniae]|nr:hypothetical protein HK104_002375 [Borealophlyctis nickersoniae]
MNNKPFRFVGFNVPSLLLNGDMGTGYQLPNMFDTEDTVDTLAGLINPVARTMPLGVKSTIASGSAYHVFGCTDRNEEAFVSLDHILNVAAEKGVKLIIPLINNNWLKSDGSTDPVQDYFGNWGDFAFLCTGNRSYEAFFEDMTVRAAFKDLITYILTRKNTVNGKLYSEDTAILALETGNELGSWEDRRPPGAWTVDIARHIKSLAPHLLVMDGTLIGWHPDRMDVLALASPYVDMFSNHYYDAGNTDVNWMRNDLAVLAPYHKAYLVGEFGLTDSATYKTILDGILSSSTSGALIWSLRSHSYRGGWYSHSEKDGTYYSYHAPGWPQRLPGFGSEEQAVVPMIFEYAAKITGVAVPQYPAPIKAPVMLETGSGGRLIWRGVAWADYYEVQHAPSNDTENWTTIGAKVVDNVEAGNTIFSDPVGTAQGSPDGKYLYRVRAFGKTARTAPSGWSNAVGPLSVPQPGELPSEFVSAIASGFSPDGRKYFFIEKYVAFASLVLFGQVTVGNDIWMLHSRDFWGPAMSTTQESWSFQAVGSQWSIRNSWSRQCIYHKVNQRKRMRILSTVKEG